MIGLCCQYLEPVIKRTGKIEYKNILNERNLQFNQFLKGKYTNSEIESVWINNCNNCYSVITRLYSENIKLFRVSSNLLPLYDLVPELLYNSESVKNILYKIGSFVKSHNMRLTTHPDQFVVISSDKQDVINKSIKMLNHHAWVMDQMGLDLSAFYAINIHGGTKGNITTLISSIKSLSDNVKQRLTLENDERSYNVKDLYKVYEETGIPICWDSHHHAFNNADLSSEEALDLCKLTWGDIKQLTHLSNTDPLFVNGSFTERRKHSDYVHYIPECQRLGNNQNELDIEFEFKMKNLAIFKAIKDFNILL
jgi:UV DNA damage endonuclease